MDPITLFLIVALAGFVVFQVFQGRKRKRETESRVSKFVPGVEIMTNYGLYGTIVEVDDERNLVTLEVSPGVEVKIHKQTMLKVADYDDVVPDDSSDDSSTNDSSTDDSITDDANIDDTPGEPGDSQPRRNADLETDADIRAGGEASEPGSAKNTPTTPAFSAAAPIAAEPAPAYGERILPSVQTTSAQTPAVQASAQTPADVTADSDQTDGEAAPIAKAALRTPRTPRKPATPRTTPARSTTPRVPRSSTSRPATPPADDAASDTSST